MNNKRQFDTSVTKKIDAWKKKFPKEKPESSIIMSLRFIQDHYGWLSDKHLDMLAEYLVIAPIRVYEVASFYSMYHRNPVGKHVLGICGSISCMLRGSEPLIHHLENKLNIKLGETTEDGLFTLKEVECLASCTKAPAMVVNGTQYVEDLTPESLDKLIDDLRQGESL